MYRSYRLTAYDRRLLWELFKAGHTQAEIAGRLEKSIPTVRRAIRERGGVAPRRRHRSAHHLSFEEREEISRGLAMGCSIRAIATKLDRSPSTICREIQRNGGRHRYRAKHADQRAWQRAQRPKRCRLADNARLCRLITKKLYAKWSPQEISGWLKHRYPGDRSMQISHETIYQALFIQARGLLKRELIKELRRAKQHRTARASNPKGKGRERPLQGLSIRERPAEVEDRAVPGHWEGDLITGTNNSYIATLVERRTRYCMLFKVANKETEEVVRVLKRGVKRLPKELWKSLTWDRGSEMTNHPDFTVATGVDVYFCDPQSPWQRGSNENTNGLLRQYFPKGTDLSVHSQRQLDKVARELNARPRQTLDFETPAELLTRSVAPTV